MNAREQEHDKTITTFEVFQSFLSTWTLQSESKFLAEGTAT
jgi:hypothetical protein